MVNALSFSAFIIILIPSSSTTLVSPLSDLIYVSNSSSSITTEHSCIFDSLSAETKKLLKLVLLMNVVNVQFKILIDNVDAADNELK